MAWRHVSHQQPCEICGNTDWCSYTDDETAKICRRIEAPKLGAIHQVDRQGGHYWLYLTKTGDGRTRVAPEVQEPPHKYQVADAQTLDRFYTRFLEQLPPLEAGHQLGLVSRGYDDAGINALGLRSWPRSRRDLLGIVSALKKEFGEDVLLSIPGFSRYETTITVCKTCKDECQGLVTCQRTQKQVAKVRIAHEGFSGYAIPLRDLQGRIRSLQLRSDEENPVHRYVHFSSSDQESCGSNVVAHVPDRSKLGIVDTRGVVVTEGFHKAELVSRRLGQLAVGLPSVAAINLALPILEELGVKRVLIAFDADASTNPAVAGALRWSVHTLTEQGYQVGLASWTIDLGKGIDDVLAKFDDTSAVGSAIRIYCKGPTDRDQEGDALSKLEDADDVPNHHEGDVIQVCAGLALWKRLADVVRAAGLPDDPIIEARIVLHDLCDKVSTDPSVAFRKPIIAAAARLARNGAEGQSFLVKMKTALPGQFTSWSKELEFNQKKIVKEARVAKAKASGKIALYRGDHAELAGVLVDRLAAEHDYYDEKRKGRYVKAIPPVATEGGIYRYVRDKGIWTECSASELSVQVQNMAGSTIGGEAILKVFSGTVEGTVACAEARCFDSGFFECAAPGVAFANCFLRLDGKQLVRRDHKPEHRARYGYPFDYVEYADPPRQFLELLHRAFKEDEDKDAKIALIQEFCGACRLGIATRFQKVLMFYGPKANDGKSTIAAVIARTMPPGATSNVRPEVMSERFKLAPLAGSLLNIVDETGTKPIDRAEVFKQVVTAKIPMEIEKKGKDPYLSLPIAGHLFSGNHYLMADDFSDGFLRRFLIIGFNSSIPESEVIAGIEEKIIAEEHPQIVLWSLEGARRLLEQGHYTIPTSSVTHKEEWTAKADPARCFVLDKLVETDDKEKWSKLGDLYKLYVLWAEAKGHKKMAENTLGSRLQKWKARSNEGNQYILMPREDHESAVKEQRNQDAADEALKDLFPPEAIELDPEEERATDYAAKQQAERWCGLN